MYNIQFLNTEDNLLCSKLSFLSYFKAIQLFSCFLKIILSFEQKKIRKKSKNNNNLIITITVGNFTVMKIRL